MEHRIISADYHRNGVGDAGFYVGIVETTSLDDSVDDGRYLCIDFSGAPENDDYDPGRFAVLNMNKLHNGNIGMFKITDPDGVVQEGTGGAAYRGADYWGNTLRDELRAWYSAGTDAKFAARTTEREDKNNV